MVDRPTATSPHPERTEQQPVTAGTDADEASAASWLHLQVIAYQASLDTLAKVAPPSLVRFLCGGRRDADAEQSAPPVVDVDADAVVLAGRPSESCAPCTPVVGRGR